jgi:hypothetical protein
MRLDSITVKFNQVKADAKMWEKWIPGMVLLVLINSPSFGGSWSQDQIAWTPIYVDTAGKNMKSSKYCIQMQT